LRKTRKLGGGETSFFLLLTSVNCRLTDVFQKARLFFGWAVQDPLLKESVHRSDTQNAQEVPGKKKTIVLPYCFIGMA